MTAVSNTPINKNFLNPLNFKFLLKRAPHVNFFVQKANIPSLELPAIFVPTVFNPIPQPETHLKYGSFSVTFSVDEDFENYLEIHNWIRGLGFPEEFEEYAALSQIPQYTGEGLKSDITLSILNSLKNPNYEFNFRDAWPTYLSSVEFDTTKTDINYITATAEFRYTLFDVVKL